MECGRLTTQLSLSLTPPRRSAVGATPTLRPCYMSVSTDLVFALAATFPKRLRTDDALPAGAAVNDHKLAALVVAADRIPDPRSLIGGRLALGRSMATPSKGIVANKRDG